jgi:hypothetical protein
MAMVVYIRFSRRFANLVNKIDKLTVIDDAKKRGLGWPEVARALNDAEQHHVLDPCGRPIARAAAKRTGYSLNQLRQMQRTLRALQALPNVPPEHLQRAFRWPFSHAEMLSRIAKLDPLTAATTIRDLAGAGTLPRFRALRDQYYALRESASRASPILAGQMAARKFTAMCLDLLKRTNAAILPDYQGEQRIQIIKWPGIFRYASPTLAIGHRNSSGKLEIDGADCYAIYGDRTNEETAKRAVRIATECTFFRRFWVFVPALSAGGQLASACQELSLNNVGIVELASNGFHWLKHASAGPLPDRRDLIPTRSVSPYFKKI